MVSESRGVDEILSVWRASSDAQLSAVDPVGGWSLLFYSAQRKPDGEAVTLSRYLIEERNVCAGNLADVNEQTALFFAARDGNVKTCEYLMAQGGCDPGLRDTAGQTALFYAAREGQVETLRALETQSLTQYKASLVNVTDRVGQSALFYAAREGQLDACEVLLELGADPRIRDWKRTTAHTYASRKGHTVVCALLKARCDEASSSPAQGTGTKAGAEPEPRHKALLQYRLPVSAHQAEWIFPTADLIEEFEAEYPDLSAWSQVHSSVYEPLDGFRIEWSQTCLDIVNILANYKDAIWFNKPVDTKALHCPDYYVVIKEPRDLTLIKKNLKELKYKKINDFLIDMDLVWSNCYKYNPAHSNVHKAALKLQSLFQQALLDKNLQDLIQRELNLFNALDS
ncbi:bromodomain domain protein [Gregarina niphandrodes]|uniref:Bromodomain domain protein n=1 Tax=Gregarina niphandrodes TaxID=110365 RepID=A0A023B8H5_GRENI|nr:bromodomain domain protein [Gregarina niphandrodes]EZG69139.1 bromodomain domain protein [Gregarina niphandrodes]|eukprot:XP_011134470.1 bromodomain domain protein [Gregarina niphandrodes]